MNPITFIARLMLPLIFAVVAAGAAQAVTPDEMSSDPVLESRARTISMGLRCVVCQNQSIDDSNAPLAHDLRVLVRERLAKGDTDQQAVDYIVSRYGNFVLLRPPFQFDTLLLWFGPLLLLGAGIPVLMRTLKMQAAAAPESSKPLSADEQKRLAAIISDDAAG